MSAAQPEPEPARLPEPAAAPEDAVLKLARAHLRFGWIALLVFVTFGAALEALHAWKSVAYLGVGHETRRLMWTLAHAHGVGLGLLHLGFAATLELGFSELSARLERAARLLRWASVFLPVGFFLGGVTTYDGDPGAGVWLVPIGALLLWSAILLVAMELAAAKR
jgi:hypothetical protein